MPRNTAPAIAAAARTVLADNQDAILVVLPSDHRIGDEKAFMAAVDRAAAIAKSGALVLFGIAPDAPSCSYGYIKCGKPLANSATGAFEVEAFVEKADLATATAYLEQGNYFWNSGIFVMSAEAYLAELERYEPVMAEACATAVAMAVADLDFVRLDSEVFANAPAISIDCAVMERTNMAAVLPISIGWSDVGSWASLWEIGKRDADGNVSQGATLLDDTRNCYVHSERALVSTLGPTISLSSRRPMPSSLPTATARRTLAGWWRGSNRAIVPSTHSTSATIDRGGISRRST
jgi:mannose-1-phosphate guanylyltransferase/mannose-6-phosphate isomerase